MLDDNKDIGFREKIKKWLDSSKEEEIIDRLVKYKELKYALKTVDARFTGDIDMDLESMEYSEYVKLLKILLLDDNTEVVKLCVELEGKNKDIRVLQKQVKQLKSDIATKEKDIVVLKNIVELKEEEIFYKEGVIQELKEGVYVKEKEANDLKKETYEKDIEIKNLKKELCDVNKALKDRIIPNKGKKHKRGTAEFYRDILKCGSLIKTRDDDAKDYGRKRYKDYREALEYAKCCETIQNYVNSNKVQLNRDNLKNWLSIAIALERGEKPPADVGKYKQNKGYK